MKFIDRIRVDWYLFIPAFLISLAGLVTMNSFTGENYFFFRQSVWILIAVVTFLVASAIDWRFLRRTRVLVPIFLIMVFVLGLLFGLAQVTRGVQSWFQFGSLAFQPSDVAKIVLIFILAKYFSRRHIEIRNLRHIIVSGVYAFIIFLLVLLQPDFGGAVVVFGVWLGMVAVSGISKRHFLSVILLGALAVTLMWFLLSHLIKKPVLLASFILWRIFKGLDITLINLLLLWVLVRFWVKVLVRGANQNFSIFQSTRQTLFSRPLLKNGGLLVRRYCLYFFWFCFGELLTMPSRLPQISKLSLVLD